MKTVKNHHGNFDRKLSSLVMMLAVLMYSSIFISCSDPEPVTTTVTKTDTVTITKTDTVKITGVKGCMDNTSLNYNASATVDDGSCVYAKDFDDTTRTWTLDKSHSNIEWETDYKDFGYSLLTGRFDKFGMDVVFNALDPTKTTIKSWVQVSSCNTGEPGRDGVGKCGPKYLGVVWKDTLVDGTTDPASLDPLTDSAFYQSTSCEMFWGKNGITYKAPGTLTFMGVTKPVDLHFTYKGITYTTSSGKVTANSGFDGYFSFKAKTDHGVTSTSVADIVTVRINARVKLALN